MERTDQTPAQPSPGDILMAARRADHLAHCFGCRTQAEASDAFAAENGASIQRRDRLTLGMRAARTAVTA